MATANSTRPGGEHPAANAQFTNPAHPAAAGDALAAIELESDDCPAETRAELYGRRATLELAPSHHDTLVDLQQQVLDALAVCSVVANALDPASGGEMIRLLTLAQKRLQDVSEGMLTIAGEIAGVAHG